MNYPATTTTIILSRPFTIDGQPVTELSMREPTVRDRLALAKGNKSALEKEFEMIASLCGLESNDLLTLPGYDYDQLVEAVNRFLLPPDQRQSNS